MAAQFITKLMKSTILLYSFCFYTTPFDNLSVKYKTDLPKKSWLFYYLVASVLKNKYFHIERILLYTVIIAKITRLLIAEIL